MQPMLLGAIQERYEPKYMHTYTYVNKYIYIYSIIIYIYIYIFVQGALSMMGKGVFKSLWLPEHATGGHFLELPI